MLLGEEKGTYAQGNAGKPGPAPAFRGSSAGWHKEQVLESRRALWTPLFILNRLESVHAHATSGAIHPDGRRALFLQAGAGVLPVKLDPRIVT